MPAPNIAFFFLFSFFFPHLPFVFIFLQSDKDNELEFSDGEKGIEDQGWKNENNMQKTNSLGLEKAGFPKLSLPLSDGAQESTCSVHHNGREEPGCQQLTTEWGLLTNKPIRSRWSRHKKSGYHLKSAKDTCQESYQNWPFDDVGPLVQISRANMTLNTIRCPK